MKQLILALVLLLCSSVSAADEPLQAPAAKRVCNHDISYCAYLDPEQDTVIYKVEGNYKLSEAYQIKGWHRSFHISPNGQHVVIGFAGLNLLPKSVKPNQVMLSIYYKGKLQHTITLSQLLYSLDSLQPTVSHYHWGSIDHVSDFHIRLDTVEGMVEVDLKSGEVYRAEKN